MYFACYQLSRLGLNVMPTARNAKGADIIAYTPDQKRFFTIQIKAMSKLTNVSLGYSLDALDCEWWIVVADVYDDPVAYVLTRDEIVKTAKLYGDTYWAQGSQFDTELTRNRWNRILEDQ